MNSEHTQPSPNTQPFDPADQEALKRWLKVGVEAYVLENAGPAAFPQAALDIIGAGGAVELGMRAFSDRLCANERELFKVAIANCLDGMEPRADRVPVVKLLLGIAIELSADAILHVLAQRIGRGFFGGSDLGEQHELFTLTLYTVARLSHHREVALICLHELISSPMFVNNPALAGTALLALCRAEPQGLDKHLHLLRGQLTRQFDKLEDPKPAQRRFAEQVLDLIGPVNFVAALPALNCLDPVRSDAGPDDWLLDALVFSPPPVLKMEGEAFRVCAHPQIVVRVPKTAVAVPPPKPKRPNLPNHVNAISPWQVTTSATGQLEQDLIDELIAQNTMWYQATFGYGKDNSNNFEEQHD